MNNKSKLNGLERVIDISAVRADVTIREIDQLIELTKVHQFICAFVLPCYTPLIRHALSGFDHVGIGGVIGFPSGGDTTKSKVFTAKELIQMGCTELDMVTNVGALKSGHYQLFQNDIKAIVEAAEGLPVKSILEVAYLSQDEMKRASTLAAEAGVSYIKTGTGWASSPTTVDIIRLIKDEIGNSVKIKAAGGVRDLQTLLAMQEAGCERFGLGISSVKKILTEMEERQDADFAQKKIG